LIHTKTYLSQFQVYRSENNEGPSLGWLRPCINAFCFSLRPELLMSYMIKLVADTKRRQQHAFATGCSPNQCSSLTSIPQCHHASSTNSDSSCASVSCHLNARNAWVSLRTYHRKKRSATWSQSAIKEKLLTFNVSNGASVVLFPLYIFPSPQADYSMAEEILFFSGVPTFPLASLGRHGLQPRYISLIN